MTKATLLQRHELHNFLYARLGKALWERLERSPLYIRIGGRLSVALRVFG